MALVTHQMQGCYAIPSRHSLWAQGITSKHFAMLRMVERSDVSSLLKKNICSSVRAPCVHLSKFKLLRISAFKGNSRSNASGSRSNGSKDQKNSVKFKDGDSSLTDTPKADEVPIYYTSDTNDGTATAPAFYRLFKKWLTLLCTQPTSQEVDEILQEIPLKQEVPNIQHEAPNNSSDDILKPVWSHFLGLNALIKIPVMIFPPLYLSVNAFYGAEASRELTPLWIMGPFIMALYIKMFHWLCALYNFSFKQTTNVIKNLPTYCQVVANSYIENGKLKEEACDRFWQPIMNIKNLDYKDVSRRILKALGDWLVENLKLRKVLHEHKGPKSQFSQKILCKAKSLLKNPLAESPKEQEVPEHLVIPRACKAAIFQGLMNHDELQNSNVIDISMEAVWAIIYYYSVSKGMQEIKNVRF